MSSGGSESEDVSSVVTSKNRVTRSSKRISTPVGNAPRKTTSATSDTKKTKRSAKTSDETQTIAETKGKGRGRPRLSTTKHDKQQSVQPDTVPQSFRGRGRGGPGRGSNTGRGRGVKPKPKHGNQHFWGTAPPTKADLAALGAKDGCKYVLSTKGRAGARNRTYWAKSRSTRVAEIAVANLYDSD